jgi:hypothetical protein
VSAEYTCANSSQAKNRSTSPFRIAHGSTIEWNKLFMRVTNPRITHSKEVIGEMHEEGESDPGYARRKEIEVGKEVQASWRISNETVHSFRNFRTPADWRFREVTYWKTVRTLLVPDNRLPRGQIARRIGIRFVDLLTRLCRVSEDRSTCMGCT